jgi:hypothetical protein
MGVGGGGYFIRHVVVGFSCAARTRLFKLAQPRFPSLKEKRKGEEISYVLKSGMFSLEGWRHLLELGSPFWRPIAFLYRKRKIYFNKLFFLLATLAASNPVVNSCKKPVSLAMTFY